jgi:hypothetical protein
LILNFGLGAGPDRTSGTLPTVWESSVTANQYVGQVNVAAATNNYWQVTGVQLELGNVASDFDFQDIQSELAACQRYYYRVTAHTVYGQCALGNAYATTAARVQIKLPVDLRAQPSSVEYANLTLQDGIGGAFVPASVTISGAVSNRQNGVIEVTGTGFTQFRQYQLSGNNNAAGFVGISAEL